jgi:hypothetical protein
MKIGIDYSGVRMQSGIQEFIRTCSNVMMKLGVRARHSLVGCRSSMRNSTVFFITLLLNFLPNAAVLSAQSAPNPAASEQDYSGMYAFLQDGEFVQLTLDQGQVTGLISRYGDATGDKREFVDNFFKEGRLEGNKLTFTTKPVQNVWFEFQGTVGRGDAQNPGDEGYYVLKGKLTQYVTDASKKTTAKAQEVSLKSFPKDLDSAPAK